MKATLKIEHDTPIIKITTRVVYTGYTTHFETIVSAVSLLEIHSMEFASEGGKPGGNE